MMNQTAPVMLINLSSCSNLGEVMALVGVAWDSGFSATMRCDLAEKDVERTWAIALPGLSVHHEKYRQLAHRIGLLAHDNLGPVLIETDGYVYQTKSDGPYPITAPCGVFGTGTGIITIEVKTHDGIKTYNIDPSLPEVHDMGCFIDY